MMISVTGLIQNKTNSKPLMPFFRKPAGGFTLLELMLVILLIGLLATMVTLNFTGASRQEKLDDEALRFQQVTQFIAETAVLKQQEWGLYVQADRYGFLYYDNNENKWLPAEEPKAVAAHKMPEHLSLTLELEGLAGEDTNLLARLDWQTDEDEEISADKPELPVLPQVFILSSGEISPFKLIFTEQSELTALYSTVSTEFSIPLLRTEAAEQLP